MKLPPNEKGIRVLKTMESVRLKEMYPSPIVLPPTPKQCITCQGTKSFRWYDDHDRVVDYECDCPSQWILHRYMLYSGIQVKYQRISWRHVLTEDPSVDVIRGYRDELDFHTRVGTGMYLHGEKGTGKTMLSILLLKYALGQGVSGHFVRFVDMINSFDHGDMVDPEFRRWKIDTMKNAGVLVIDDPGGQDRSNTTAAVDYYSSITSEVLRYRSGSCLPTIITSNLTDEEFVKRYSDLDSLMNEQMIIQQVQGKDRRSEQRVISQLERERGVVRPIVLA